ncbi:MAG: hypothetical protein KGO94_11015 [Alphaproteobacteria bacterium]|nr:hypothetical protein [Alphaproteobacteria bacterium]
MARDAVKMAGLPVFVLAANAWFTALMMFVKTEISMAVVYAFLAIGVVLLVIALRMRSGRAALMPFALVPLATFIMLVVLQTLRGAVIRDSWQVQLVELAGNWVVPALCAILAYRGLRGWFWLRAQKCKMSY